MSRFIILLFAFLSLLNPFYLAFADDAAVKAHDNAEELRILRKEVAELRAIVEKLTQGHVENKTEIVENKSGIVENKTELAEIKPKPHSDFDVPSLSLRGFGDFQYDYVDESFIDSADEDTNHFTNGDVGFMIYSQISQKLSFFSETLFEFKSGGETDFDVERVLLKYEYADWLNISIGRDHTPLGYWNQHYHHASWSHTTVDRPLIFRFEGDDGILPIHYVGLGVSGNLAFDFANINYSLMIGNGRGKVTSSVQIVEDLNDDKQVAFKFTVEPNALKGFGFGANILYDVIPNNADLVGRENEIDELIAGAHFYYTQDPYELIAEYQYIHHDDLRSTKSHHGGYLQLAYIIDKFKPYYRLDVLDITSDDPYFHGLRDVEDSIQHTFGVRYEWFPFAALKLEYRRMDSDSVDSNAIASQVSFMY